MHPLDRRQTSAHDALRRPAMLAAGCSNTVSVTGKGPFMIAVTGHLSKQLENEYGDLGEMTKRLVAEKGEEVGSLP